MAHNCENCKFRAHYDKGGTRDVLALQATKGRADNIVGRYQPHSFLGKFFAEQSDQRSSAGVGIYNYKVITLCGSTRFKDQFLDEPSGRAERIETQKRLTLEGCIVISVGLFGHSGDEKVWKPGTKEMLDDMHKRKIDMADEIFAINVGGYIGESTRSEIAYAEKTGKKVNYLEPIV